MSVATASTLGFSIIFLTVLATVNCSLLQMFCRNPNGELCTALRRLNELNRYNQELSELNSRYSNSEYLMDGPSFDQLEALIQPPQSRMTEQLLQCINLGDDSCNNGVLPGSGKDDDYLSGGGNPGKRSQSNGKNNGGKISQFRSLPNHHRA